MSPTSAPVEPTASPATNQPTLSPKSSSPTKSPTRLQPINDSDPPTVKLDFIKEPQIDNVNDKGNNDAGPPTMSPSSRPVILPATTNDDNNGNNDGDDELQPPSLSPSKRPTISRPATASPSSSHGPTIDLNLFLPNNPKQPSSSMKKVCFGQVVVLILIVGAACFPFF